jgi:hypothetical protein
MLASLFWDRQPASSRQGNKLSHNKIFLKEINMSLRQKMFFVLISMVLLSATALADPISAAVKAPLKAPNAAFSASPIRELTTECNIY